MNAKFNDDYEPVRCIMSESASKNQHPGVLEGSTFQNVPTSSQVFAPPAVASQSYYSNATNASVSFGVLNSKQQRKSKQSY